MEELLTFLQTYHHALLDGLGALLGFIYLWYEYHADARLWPVSMIMPAIDIYLYYKVGLYADFGMAIYYFCAAAYGWFAWSVRRGATKAQALPITHLPKRVAAYSLAVFLPIWGALYYILSVWTNSTVPFLDSLANALSIIALWMLARKYVEQWLVWIVVDIILCGLYVYKGVPFHGVLYGAYVLIALVGFRKWRTMAVRA